MERYQLEGIVRQYRESGTGRMVDALRVTQLEVKPGEILAVVGHNGSGKSTLLETMAFLHKPDEGRILLDGQDVWAEGKPLDARRRCPILLQKTVLFKTSVLKNVMYGLRLRGLRRDEAGRRAENVLRLVGLERLAHRRHRELSGGERQRVALARALVLEPEILLMDEPTAHVDRANELLIEEVIREMHARTGMTVVMAGHNARQAMTLADRIVTMLSGRLIEGTMDNLFTGTLRAEDDGFVFHGETGLLLQLASEAIVLENGNALPPPDEPVQIAIDTDLLKIVAAEEPTVETLKGKVESIRRHGDRCRLRVRLDEGHRLRSEMTFSEYQRLNINLGITVRLRIAEGAVRLIGTPRATGPES
ncbi:MAG: ABC transporter ATP-binding protein [Thermoguttaceae bacterium]